MIGKEEEEECGQEGEGERPGAGDVACEVFQAAGEHDEQALPGDGGDAVEGAADADVHGLLVWREGEHVEAVGGDVVRGRAEGHQPEEGECPLQGVGRGDGECDSGQRRAYDELHRDDPPSLRAHQVDDGTPEGFDDPGQIEPRGVERDVGIGDAQPFVHHDGYGHHGHVGQGFGEVEGRYPGPGVAVCLHVSVEG